jgi:hypothetical protein
MPWNRGVEKDAVREGFHRGRWARGVGEVLLLGRLDRDGEALGLELLFVQLGALFVGREQQRHAGVVCFEGALGGGVLVQRV